MGDSSFDHVPMLSPIVPKLVRTHRKTITMHSLPKRGVVVWSLGMRKWYFYFYFASLPALLT
jgi:hypothetical protein